METAKKAYNRLVKTEEYRMSDDATMYLALTARGFNNIDVVRGKIKFLKEKES
jgi:hypothetical protein